ncbi:twin-arginine translocase TatA/TatE family subunit [Kocuria arenosa]|uniref:twin-arginine translocase TatA/TatE family subunit n=1 Tax=Kocuria arenosa TaxID=3071446 RepID=UPI003F6727F1
MARLVDSPMSLLLILLVVLLLFGAPRLPGMARSLGQSLRIFKSEVAELKQDDPTGEPGAADPVRSREAGI